MNKVSPDHPRLDLVFVIIGGTRPSLDIDLEALLQNISHTRSWTLGPPEMVELEQEGRIGGVLQVYSALPPWGDKLPKDVDAANLDEVKSLVRALKQFSSAHGVEIEFELGGIDVGAIRNGSSNQNLAEGLLDEWGRMLNGRP